MAIDDLTAFLKYAAESGELVRISAAVDPVGELSAISQAVSQAHGGWSPVLLFENVRGSRFPVVTHLLSSVDRLQKVLAAASIDEAVERVKTAFTPRFSGAEGWFESLRLLPSQGDQARVMPKVLRSGLCQQIVKLGKDVSLSELPVPHCWPGESGRVITAGITHLTGLQSPIRHLGLYPAEVVSPDSLLLHWTAQDPANQLFREYLRAGRQMPIALSLGGDPLLTCVASLPLPDLLDPYLLAGILRGENINLVKGRSVELEIPAESEFVLEGYLDPLEPTGTGVVANRQGYFTTNDELPLMRVTGITHRANPVFPVLVRGIVPCEEHVYPQLTERLLLPVARLLDPAIVDLHLPLAGSASRILFVAIQKSRAHQARRVMNTLWGLPQFSLAKMIIVVDEGIDLRQPDAVWQQVSANAYPQRDLVVQEGIADLDDHASPVRGLGSKLGIDATSKSLQEGHPRRWPAAVRPAKEIIEQLQAQWGTYGLGEIPAPR